MTSVSADTRRDVRVIGLVGVAHFFSHFYQLTLPALIPLIHAQDGISYTRLGVLTTLFFLCSGIFQTPAGFLVDRIGARTMLILGCTVLGGSIALFGLAPNYPTMVVLAVIGGLANSIYHPADYSLLTATISETRIGRAYSMHGFGGFGGYAAAPVVMLALGTWLGWREAMVAAGLAGLAVAAVLYAVRRELIPAATRDTRETAPADEAVGDGVRILLKPVVILCFLFFMLIAMGQVGMMTLGPSALMAELGTPAAIANGSVSALMTGVIGGVLIGGVLADKQDRHDLVTAIGALVAAAFYLAIPALKPDGTLMLALFVVAGVFYGLTGPARDMVVRSIAPPESRGKVFGFAFSGLDFGSAMSAVMFGAMLDAGLSRWVFTSIAAFMVLSVGSILLSQFLARREAAR